MVTTEIGYSLGFIGILMVAVQGFFIRWVLPRTGLRYAGIIGMTFTIVAFTGYATANSVWMIYVVMLPGALGALAGPAMQGIASSQVGDITTRRVAGRTVEYDEPDFDYQPASHDPNLRVLHVEPGTSLLSRRGLSAGGRTDGWQP